MAITDHEIFPQYAESLKDCGSADCVSAIYDIAHCQCSLHAIMADDEMQTGCALDTVVNSSPDDRGLERFIVQ